MRVGCWALVVGALRWWELEARRCHGFRRRGLRSLLWHGRRVHRAVDGASSRRDRDSGQWPWVHTAELLIVGAAGLDVAIWLLPVGALRWWKREVDRWR